MGNRMNCDELRPDYTAYARGTGSEAERTGITAHIERNCPNCVPGVASALATITGERRPKRFQVGIFLPWAITAALSAVLIAVGISGQRQIGDTAKFARALAILNDPAARDVSFGETAKRSKGRVFVSPGNGVAFIGANLPRIDSDKTFELWVVPAKGNPVPAGVFQSQPDATAVFVRPGPVDDAAAIELTVEPEGGSSQPTNTPFILIKTPARPAPESR
jgi:hypothetical protein